MKKSKVIVVRYKTGGVYRRFSSVLALGQWLFSRRGRPDFLAVDRKVLCNLDITKTLARRASNAYVAWLMGTSRIRPH